MNLTKEHTSSLFAVSGIFTLLIGTLLSISHLIDFQMPIMILPSAMGNIFVWIICGFFIITGIGLILAGALAVPPKNKPRN
ncbi:MAG: hypothetical protein PF637_02155 [Spirochaetes bacterium]|jgi:hypothetical protein|nr:hypothetical protein [Spirochaetota bacterium]